MSSAPSPEEIARDATWLAQAIDPAGGMARLVAMDRESYRAASFLDDRLLQQPCDSQVVAWPQLEAAAAAAKRSDARWIFHIGHVGSTLVSRLLGETHGVLAVREPRMLRDLALSPVEVRPRYLASVPKLMSRSFAAEEVACVKATSFASEIAAEIVPAGERALFMYARPRAYVAGILAGENSVEEMRLLARTRVHRLGQRGVTMPAAGNDAELAAIGWATEMVSLEAAAEAMPDRLIVWEDFDAMLEEIAGALGRVAAFFGFAADEEGLRALASGPLMSRYSKAPEYEYSPGLRQDLLAEAGAQFSREIDGGLAMLRSAAEKSPLLASALARAGEA